MLDFVLWFFLLSLAPWALWLARILIFGAPGLINLAAVNEWVAFHHGPELARDVLQPLAAPERSLDVRKSAQDLIVLSVPCRPRPGSRELRTCAGGPDCRGEHVRCRCRGQHVSVGFGPNISPC
jgi:hypothetical protein